MITIPPHSRLTHGERERYLSLLQSLPDDAKGLIEELARGPRRREDLDLMRELFTILGIPRRAADRVRAI